MKKLLSLSVFLFLVLRAPPSWATVFYVSWSSGNDANSCATAQSATIGNAKKTLASLLSNSCVASGDTIRIHGGTSAEPGFSTSTAGRNIPNGTSWNAATIIENYNGVATWQYTGNAAIRFQNSNSYIILRSALGTTNGLVIDGVNGQTNTGSGGTGAFNMMLSGSTHHIKFENLEMTHSTLSNIYSDLNTHDIWITGNYIHNNGTFVLDHGVYMEGDSSIIEHNRLINSIGTGTQFYCGFSGCTSDNNIFRDNWVQDNGAGGLVIDGINDQVYNNVFVSNGTTSVFAGGITCGYAPGSTGAKIYNNDMHAQDGYGIVLGQGGTCTGVDIRNNSISSNSQNCVLKGSNTVTGTIDHNNCSGNGSNTINVTGATVTPPTTVAPAYVNAAALDFALTDTSGLIDQGADLGSGFLFNGSKPDIGAHETIVFTSASILDDVSDNKLAINFESNAAPGLLPLTGCAGFSAQKNGSLNTILSCTRTATNQITLTLTNGYANGDTVRFDYVTASGTVTDSALIGNLNNQRLNAITNANFLASGLGGGGTAPILDQVACAFGSYGGTETTPDSSLPTGTDLTLPPGGCGTVRCQVSNTQADALITSYTFYAQENGSGSYAPIPNGPCPAGTLCFPTGAVIQPPELMLGATTEHLFGTGTFRPGGILFSTSQIPNIPLLVGQDTELLVPFCAGTSTAGKFFNLRVYGAGGIALNTYTQTPKVTISSTGYYAQSGAR